jgi:hypothetical protein
MADPNAPVPKSLLHHEGFELRVEQIGPDLWGGSCYDSKHRLFVPWRTWSSIGEETAKREAWQAAEDMMVALNVPITSDRSGDWRDLGDMPDEDWDSRLKAFGCPENRHPGHDGIKRFPKRAAPK